MMVFALRQAGLRVLGVEFDLFSVQGNVPEPGRNRALKATLCSLSLSPKKVRAKLVVKKMCCCNVGRYLGHYLLKSTGALNVIELLKYCTLFL